MTPNELYALYVNHVLKAQQDQMLAAFSGYSAGAAFSLAFSGKLEEFSEFYHVPDMFPEKTESEILEGLRGTMRSKKLVLVEDGCQKI
jgi:hypothetical protein